MILPNDTAALRALAPIAAARWAPGAWSVRHIADSGNSVYLMESPAERRILRLTSPAYRSRAQNQAEAEFLLHLRRHGVSVSTPIASADGNLVEEIAGGGLTMLASAFTYAPGERPAKGPDGWDESLIRAWGRTLGSIHRASRSFTPAAGTGRWHWRDEGFIANAGALIPADDTASREELDRVLEHLAGLPADPSTFGIIHADFAPQNFHYDPDAGLTAFDFGNCCHHWFAADIAVSLSTLRALPREERDRYREWLLDGYRAEHPIDDAMLREMDWFIRLRILYVYLSRLTKFGPSPTDDERATLASMRAAVHETFAWRGPRMDQH
jgi:Ser/Thr protein kinase RdoA (MazF antagonist)